jgi:Flp pilus assembly protein TadB
VLTSWLSLAFSVAAYSRARRNSRQAALKDLDKDYPEYYATLKHQVFEFFWRLCETGGRVLAIATFATVFKWWVLAVLVPHALVMLVWYGKKERREKKLIHKWEECKERLTKEEDRLEEEEDALDEEDRMRMSKRNKKEKDVVRSAKDRLQQEKDALRSEWAMTNEQWDTFETRMQIARERERGAGSARVVSTEQNKRDVGARTGKMVLLAADFLLAYVSLFAFIPRTGIAHKGFTSMPHAYIRYIVFYLFFYVENLVMILVWWFLDASCKEDVLNNSLLVLMLSALPAHIALMLIYYGCCHPKSKDIRTRALRELWFVDRLWKRAGEGARSVTKQK